MLQQILDTGYIDPELEEQLTEEQKEVGKYTLARAVSTPRMLTFFSRSLASSLRPVAVPKDTRRANSKVERTGGKASSQRQSCKSHGQKSEEKY